jgi:short-subunit dehydrogenase
VVHPTWVRTPLIEPLTARPDFKDIVLEPEDVSRAIANQVLAGKSGQLILPTQMNMVTTIRAWPQWLQTSVRNQIAPLLSFYEGR